MVEREGLEKTFLTKSKQKRAGVAVPIDKINFKSKKLETKKDTLY